MTLPRKAYPPSGHLTSKGGDEDAGMNCRYTPCLIIRIRRDSPTFTGCPRELSGPNRYFNRQESAVGMKLQH